MAKIWRRYNLLEGLHGLNAEKGDLQTSRIQQFRFFKKIKGIAATSMVWSHIRIRECLGSNIRIDIRIRECLGSNIRINIRIRECRKNAHSVHLYLKRDRITHRRFNFAIIIK